MLTSLCDQHRSCGFHSDPRLLDKSRCRRDSGGRGQRPVREAVRAAVAPREPRAGRGPAPLSPPRTRFRHSNLHSPAERAHVTAGLSSATGARKRHTEPRLARPRGPSLRPSRRKDSARGSRAALPPRISSRPPQLPPAFPVTRGAPNSPTLCFQGKQNKTPTNQFSRLR